MAHHDGCKPKLPLGLDDQVVDGPRQEGIQSRGRLVEQDDLRPHHERARQSRPLPHATAQLGWKLMAHPRQPHLVQHLEDFPFDLGLFQFRLLAQGKGDVLKDGQRVEERRALEQHGELLPHLVELARAQPRNIHPIHQHLTAIRFQESDHMLEQDALATAATADDRGHPAPRNLKIDAVQDRLPAERLLHPYEADHRVRCTSTHHNNTEVRK